MQDDRLNEINFLVSVIKNEIIIMKNKIDEYDNEVIKYTKKIDIENSSYILTNIENFIIDMKKMICEFENLVDEFIKKIYDYFKYKELILGITSNSLLKVYVDSTKAILNCIIVVEYERINSLIKHFIYISCLKYKRIEF